MKNVLKIKQNRNCSHDCVLFFPPVGFQFIFPEVGLPQLNSYLRSKGINSIAFDLNYSFINKYIIDEKNASAKRIKRSKKNIQNKRIFSKISINDIISLNYDKYLNSSSELIRNEAFNLLNEIFGFSCSSHNVKNVIKEIKATNDPFLNYFFERFIKNKIMMTNIIGFSILSINQLITTLYFCKLIKKQRRDAKIVLGGPWCICSKDNLKNFKPIFDFIDFVITTEGEIPLLKLITSLKKRFSKNDLIAIEGLTFLLDKSLFQNKKTAFLNLYELPVCDFDNFGTIEHLGNQMPVLTSKGCYWGKCTFCHCSNDEDVFRLKNISQIVREIKKIQAKYNTKKICFADLSTPPKLLKEISFSLIKNGIKISWECLLRADENITLGDLAIFKKSGCDSISVGLESSSQQALKKIKKGIKIKKIEELMDHCLRLDIKLNLFILSYPIQDRREYADTWDYLISRREKINKVTPQEFQFARNTDFYKNSGLYRVKQPKNNKYNLSSFSLPFSIKKYRPFNDFFDTTLKFSEIFDERKNNYFVNKRILSEKNKTYLLIRPPTIEVENSNHHRLPYEYSEPTALLKMVTFLKQVGHKVSLIDCLENSFSPKNMNLSAFKKVKCGNFATEKHTKIIYRRGISKEYFDKLLNRSPIPDEIFITTCFTFEYDLIKETIQLCKATFPSARIVIGGTFATLCPNIAKNMGCEVFIGLFNSLDNCETDLSMLKYQLKSAVVKVSRGCKNMCSYCSVPILEGRVTRFKETKSILKEILYKYTKFNVRLFRFWESNIFGNNSGFLFGLLNKISNIKKDIAIEFPEGLQPNLLSRSLAKKMRTANVKRILLAYESHRNDFIKDYSRPKNSQDLKIAIDNLINEKVFVPFSNNKETAKVSAFLLFGLPNQTEDDIVKSIIGIWTNGLTVCPQPFTPIPMTKLYNDNFDLLKRKELIELHQLVWPFASEKMTVDFLERVLLCSDKNSFFQVEDEILINRLKAELQKYVINLDAKKLDILIQKLQKGECLNENFVIIRFTNFYYSPDLRSLREKLKKFLTLLKSNRQLFYLYRPIPDRLLSFNEFWHLNHIPKDCKHCLDINCTQKFKVSVGSSESCENGKSLKNPCNAWFSTKFLSR